MPVYFPAFVSAPFHKYRKSKMSNSIDNIAIILSILFDFLLFLYLCFVFVAFAFATTCWWIKIYIIYRWMKSGWYIGTCASAERTLTCLFSGEKYSSFRLRLTAEVRNGKTCPCSRIQISSTGVELPLVNVSIYNLLCILSKHSILCYNNTIFMVALCNRADHYIFPCGFYLSSSFFFLLFFLA